MGMIGVGELNKATESSQDYLQKATLVCMDIDMWVDIRLNTNAIQFEFDLWNGIDDDENSIIEILVGIKP